MHYHIQTEPGLWTVGHDKGNNGWNPIKDCDSLDEANTLVAKLNGYNEQKTVPQPSTQEISDFRQRCEDGCRRLNGEISDRHANYIDGMVEGFMKGAQWVATEVRKNN